MKAGKSFVMVLIVSFFLVCFVSLKPFQGGEAVSTQVGNGYETPHGQHFTAEHHLQAAKQMDFSIYKDGLRFKSGKQKSVRILQAVAALLCTAVFSYWVCNKRMLLVCVQFYTYLLARFLCEWFIVERKDGKKRETAVLA